MTKNINDRGETEFASVGRSKNMHRTESNQVNEENVIALGQRKKAVSLLNDEFCVEQAFQYLLPKGIFGYNAFQDIPRSPTWDFNQYFALDAD